MNAALKTGSLIVALCGVLAFGYILTTGDLPDPHGIFWLFR